MTVESRLWPGSSAGKGRVWSIWTHFAPPIAWLSLTGGGERVFRDSIPLLFSARWWWIAVSVGPRVYRRCLAGVFPVASVGRTVVARAFSLRRGRVGVEHPTMGDGFSLASPGPDSTVAPGVKSVLEPFERGPVHGGREMNPSHWRSLIPIRVPYESVRLVAYGR